MLPLKCGGLGASDWFEITKEGFVTEKNIPALKESGGCPKRNGQP